MIPTPVSSIIGRDAELLYARSLLRRHDVRPLTLTGPGGVGKTRRAIEIARLVASDYPEGAFFVPLASITNPDLVLPAIASTMGLRTAATPTALGEALGESDLLLAIDNFEQVEVAAPLISELLRAAPGLRIMVTSRSLLRVSGEHQLQVVPLAAPGLARLPQLTELAAIPAVNLFVTRSAAVIGAFTLTPENAPLVTLACSRLDGLPLAIELAAARLRHLAVFLALAEAANDALEGPERGVWLQRLDTEQANVRVAIQRAMARRDSEHALRLRMALWNYWNSHESSVEGRRWLEQAVTMSTEAPIRLRVRAVHILGNLALTSFDLDAAGKYYREATAIWRDIGDDEDVAMGELGLGAVKRYQGQYPEALEHYARVRAIWTAANDRPGVAIVEHSIAALLADAGELAESRAAHDRALAARRQIGEPYGLAYTLVSAAITDRWTGANVTAMSRASEARTQFESLGHSQGSVLAILVLALLAADRHDDAEAFALLRSALGASPGSLSVKAAVEALEAAAVLLMRRDMARLATTLLSAASAHRLARRLVLPIPERTTVADTRAAIANTLGVAAFSSAWSEGQHLSLEQAVTRVIDAIDDPIRAASDRPAYDLTRRELEILSLLAEHLSDREIADRLFLSPRTIERHVSNILLKMEAPNRRLAAAKAVRERLVATSP